MASLTTRTTEEDVHLDGLRACVFAKQGDIDRSATADIDGQTQVLVRLHLKRQKIGRMNVQVAGFAMGDMSVWTGGKVRRLKVPIRSIEWDDERLCEAGTH